MSDPQEKQQMKAEWDRYCAEELARARPLVEAEGFQIDDTQVHIGGERYLMSGRKLVLTGSRRADGMRVMIKVSSDAAGKAEIEAERNACAAVQTLNFSYRRFFVPEELFAGTRRDVLIVVTKYIHEEKPFLQHEPKEQFFLALRALETQEGVHVATADHARAIRGVFGVVHAAEYLRDLTELVTRIRTCLPQDAELGALMDRAAEFCTNHQTEIDLYGDFLTHTDFVPHNLRTVGNDIYLLDYSSIRFANKYESWARFLNFMVIHDPLLERWLTRYVKENRPAEYGALQAMRVYKIVYLIDFYARSLAKIEGDLLALNAERIRFWMTVLACVLEDRAVPDDVITGYKNARDRLRSEGERLRQKELAQLT